MVPPSFRGWSWNRIALPETGSTNDEVRVRLLRGDARLPLVVVTTSQTAGRGRDSRTWWSDSGSLTFSVGLDPSSLGITLDQAPRIALATAVSIIEALEPALLPSGTLGIRWPNDLETGGRKLAGILPEWVATSTGPRIILGIGLNVTTDFSIAPKSIREMATSVAQLHPRIRPDPDAILEMILSKLPPVLQAISQAQAALTRRYQDLDLLRDQPIRVDTGARIIRGRGAGITGTGGLRLLIEDGEPGQAKEMVLHGGRVLRDPA